MTMVKQRDPEKPRPVSARERAIPFAPMAETKIATIVDRARVLEKHIFRASRSQHRAAVLCLARSRRPGRAPKSP